MSKKPMYEKYDLSDDVIEKYGFNKNSGPKGAITDKELNLLLVEVNVHYSLLPDREFFLLFREIKYPISSRIESYNPYIIRLNAYLNGLQDINEYEFAKIIRDSVATYDRFYQPNKAWYCVSLINSAKPKPKSEIHRLDSIINSLCLYGRECSVSFVELSKRLLSQISSHGYDKEDLEKFIESGEFVTKLSKEGKEFISFWVNGGKNIKGQYIAIKPPTVFNFFEFDNIKVLKI